MCETDSWLWLKPIVKPRVCLLTMLRFLVMCGATGRHPAITEQTTDDHLPVLS